MRSVRRVAAVMAWPLFAFASFTVCVGAVAQLQPAALQGKSPAPSSASGQRSQSSATTDPISQGIEAVRQGRYKESIPLLEKGLKTSSKNVAGRIALAQAHIALDDYENGLIQAKQAVEDDPNSSPAHFWLGNAYGLKAMRIARVRAMFLANDIQREYKTAITLDPKNADARHRLMEFYMVAPSVAGGSFEKAREQADAIVAIDPVRGLGDLARVANAMKDEAGVMAALDRLAKIEPAQAILGRGQYFIEKKDNTRAASELMKVADQKPRKAADLISAAVLLQSIERWDDALTMLAYAEADEPGNMQATYQVGRACLLSKKDLPRSEAAFKKFLSSNPPPGAPGHAAAHWRLGQVYSQMGRKADARREVEEAVRQNPNNEDFKKTLAELK